MMKERSWMKKKQAERLMAANKKATYPNRSRKHPPKLSSTRQCAPLAGRDQKTKMLHLIQEIDELLDQ